MRSAAGRLLALALLGGGLLLPIGAVPAAAEEAGDGDRLKLSGDFRLRLESDWDSRRADGSRRADRDRARVRVRLGVELAAAPRWTVGLRLRAGSRDAQQSPHVTVADFDDGPTGGADLIADRWSLSYRGERATVRLGRDGFPFWKQNELFWDDDVTPAGLSLGYRWEGGGGDLSLRAGRFALLDGAVDFHGALTAAQVVYTRREGSPGWTAAVGLFLFDGEPGARLLRNGNGARDYAIWLGSLQLALEVGERPLKLGLDLMHNAESYSPRDGDPFTAANRDQRDGLVLSGVWGGTGARGDWLLGAYWARVETLAVHASYAGDDWMRWGSASQADASDYEGLELRVAVGLAPRMNLMARLYLLEAITSVQDGKRFRLDYNVRF